MIAAFPPRAASRARAQWYYYLDRPEWTGGDPDKRAFELVNGVEVEKKMGAFETGLANDLHVSLGAFLQAHRFGRSHVNMEVEFPATGARRKPDLIFVSSGAWPVGRRIPSDAWWPVTPDLAVEVISPYELTHASLAKVQEYFAAGVKAVWLVLPNVEQVYCYSSPTTVRILTRADDLTGDPLIPGFRLPLADLFPHSDPEPGAGTP